MNSAEISLLIFASSWSHTKYHDSGEGMGELDTEIWGCWAGDFSRDLKSDFSACLHAEIIKSASRLTETLFLRFRFDSSQSDRFLVLFKFGCLVKFHAHLVLSRILTNFPT